MLILTVLRLILLDLRHVKGAGGGCRLVTAALYGTYATLVLGVRQAAMSWFAVELGDWSIGFICANAMMACFYLMHAILSYMLVQQLLTGLLPYPRCAITPEIYAGSLHRLLTKCTILIPMAARWQMVLIVMCMAFSLPFIINTCISSMNLIKLLGFAHMPLYMKLNNISS